MSLLSSCVKILILKNTRLFYCIIDRRALSVNCPLDVNNNILLTRLRTVIYVAYSVTTLQPDILTPRINTGIDDESCAEWYMRRMCPLRKSVVNNFNYVPVGLGGD